MTARQTFRPSLRAEDALKAVTNIVSSDDPETLALHVLNTIFSRLTEEEQSRILNYLNDRYGSSIRHVARGIKVDNRTQEPSDHTGPTS